MRPPSLTLRDYSKVVAAAHKLLHSRKISFPENLGGFMPSLRPRYTAVCLVAALSLLLPALLPAQGTSGRIIGRVADPSGAVLANVKVTLVNEATNVSRDSTTNSAGDYDFIEVRVGSYRSVFDLSGVK